MGESLIRGERVSVLDDGKLLEMESGKGCTALCMYLVPVN